MTKLPINYVYLIFFDKYEQLKVGFDGLTEKNYHCHTKQSEIARLDL